MSGRYRVHVGLGGEYIDIGTVAMKGFADNKAHMYLSKIFDGTDMSIYLLEDTVSELGNDSYVIEYTVIKDNINKPIAGSFVRVTYEYTE